MAEVQIIKASSNRVNRRLEKNQNKIRVAPYCRVSTDSEEQINSYNSQVSHYRTLVESNSEWELVDIYADEGITGTQVYKRTDFQRMVNDALDGKIDLIITKSISRFARNTLDTLKYVRLLKEHNIAIFFEKENINTLTMNGEMLLVILSSLAQQESESISANVKLGLKMKMKRGELIGFNGCLGYDYDPINKVITINEEEAKIVRYIFQRYIEGAGCFVIAKELSKLSHKTKKGNTNWTDSSVRRIVKNEKYVGDLLLGKTFTLDPISHRRLENMGEEEKYYISSNHESIISRETFEQAQKILNIRSSKTNNKGRGEKYSRKFAFSSKIKCGFCEGTAIRRKWHSSTIHEKYVWHCITSSKKAKRYCPDSKGLDEKIIEDAFIEAFNILCRDNKEIIDEFLKNVEKSLSNTTIEKQIRSIQKEIGDNENKIKKLVDMRIDEVIDKKIYEEKYNELVNKIESLKIEKFDMEVNLDEENIVKKRVNNFRKIFDSNNPITEFDRILFDSIIEEIILGGIDDNGEKNPFAITFKFKSGVKVVKDCKDIKHPYTSKKKCSYDQHDTCGDCGEDSKEIAYLM